MHLTKNLLLLGLVAALMVAVAPRAQAAARVSGDTIPATTPFGPLDINGDGNINALDEIDDDGNQVFDNLFDPVFGPATMVTDPIIWEDYGTNQNILVGETSIGTLAITAGTAVRYQHLVLGGIGEFLPGVTLGSNAVVPFDGMRNFNYLDQASAIMGGTQVPVSGRGIVTVSGTGSVFSNDPQAVEGEFRLPLLANAWDVVANGGVPGEPRPVGGGGVDAGFDVVVGLAGRGELTVSVGGRVQIQDALAIGIGPQANGTVTVEGNGSTITAAGRSEIMTGGMSMATNTPSIVGGGGFGQLSLLDNGTVDFFNGLAIGFIPSAASVTPTDTGTGVVTLVDSGTSMSVFATLTALDRGAPPAPAPGTPANQIVRNIALAVGGLGGQGQPSGSGVLRIGESARVDVVSAASYGTDDEFANVFVGEAGRIEVQGGTLTIGNQLSNAGQIALAGGVIDTGVPTTPTSTPAISGTLYNGSSFTGDQFQGSLSGFGTMRVGRVENAQGSIIDGGVFTASNGAQIVGGALRIVASGDAAPIATEPVSNETRAAFSNRGVVRGAIDFEIGGNFENGATGIGSLASTLVNPANGGVVQSSGQILSSHFFNRRSGRVSVVSGTTLSILSNGENPLFDASLLQDAATPVRDGIPDSFDATGNSTVTPFTGYYQANLGSIAVNGGSLEAGRLGDTDTQPLDQRDLTLMFRNARFYQESTATTIGEAVGTITGNNAELTFRDGLYNTGVLSFTGGINTVRGTVINSSTIDYSDPSNAATTFRRSGIIDIGGIDTTVTFEDDVIQYGELYVGAGNQANFLGNLDAREGELRLAIDLDDVFSGGAPIVVNGDVIFGGEGFTIVTSNGNPANLVEGFSITLLSATGDIFQNAPPSFANVPVLPAGVRWQLIYDGLADVVRLDIVSSTTPAQGDSNNDGIVDVADFPPIIDRIGMAVPTVDAAFNNGRDLDFNRNGVIDSDDLRIAQVNFGPVMMVGPGGSGAAVPEPSAVVLALLAVGGLTRRRVG
ncbi:beta strand repeat-containing protein [Botrimarina hoheduenensis]|uniref:Dockerin domain-containing protein n=1 Tax=Botrimarina hoheduenensis TaxID=2528000 RepID=A0A5C5W8Z4_9BACT|nr:hypothetical protein [Botrimarina hoheduenensis]TWT47358.1 hypothetical protein Pla111_09710 [Botrimarina hoheduenensis]